MMTCHKNKYQELMMWLDDTNNNWNILNTYGSAIFAEKRDLDDIKYGEMMKT